MVYKLTGTVRRRVTLAVLAAALAAPASALASYGNWPAGELAANGGRNAWTTRTDLETSTSSVAWNRVASAGGHYPGGWDLAGTYAQGGDFACKEWNYGTNNLGALVKNIHTVPVQTWAGESYGSHHLCNW